MARQRVRLVTWLLVALGPTSIAPASAASRDRDQDGLRDGWEQRWGVTSARDADSDRDGLLDAAEDPDHDGLSNLGEQRFRTAPSRADTDGDGTRDWREDTDEDGRPDGSEQDRRGLPAGLRPSLSGASEDLPVAYRNGCHSGGSSRTVQPCVFGDPRGRVRVTLFGDSHALQWLPALDRTARANHWRVTSITKSACPSADVRYNDDGPVADRPSCDAWRSDALNWIRRHPQDLVIVANSRGYDLMGARGRDLPKAAADAAWRAGLGRTLRAMPDDLRLLVLGDAPAPGRAIPRCLTRNPRDISACQRSRRMSWGAQRDRAEEAAAKANGALFRSPATTVCPYDPCPLVIGRTLLWRDKSHLTATFARQLAPLIRRFVLDALDGSPRVAGPDSPAGPDIPAGPDSPAVRWWLRWLCRASLLLPSLVQVRSGRWEIAACDRSAVVGARDAALVPTGPRRPTGPTGPTRDAIRSGMRSAQERVLPAPSEPTEQEDHQPDPRQHDPQQGQRVRGVVHRRRRGTTCGRTVRHRPVRRAIVGRLRGLHGLHGRRALLCRR